MQNKKMRIGILTLSSSDNCGSLLQTYALQKKLSDLGYENVEVIDFQSEISKKAYDIFPKDIYLQPRKLLLSILNYKKLKKQKDDYNLFRKKQLVLSKEKYATVEDMKKLKEHYDVVVCGSDQVWNVCMYDFSEAFFLPDVTGVKKVAYAASLGGKSFKNYKDIEKLKKWLGDFDKISVRESAGKGEVRSFYDGEVDVLADPTLLLEQEEWIKVAGSKRLVEEDYIFYYSWSYSDKDLISKVQKIAENLGKPVYVINASKWLIHSYKQYGFHLCEEGGPYAFTNLMYYADLVFVESLHGTIFSTIYQKNFWYLNGCRDGSIDQRNNYFLNLLGMSDRIIGIDTAINMEEVQKSIPYQGITPQAEQMINDSITWLRKAMEE